MNMQVNNQAAKLEHAFKAEMYSSLHTASNTCIIRLIGIGVGVVSGFSTIVTRIALIAENLIKGIGNILCARYCENCKFRTGLNQLFIQVPKNVILLPFSIISAVLGVADKTLGVGFNPKGYFFNKWRQHDPEAAVQL